MNQLLFLYNLALCVAARSFQALMFTGKWLCRRSLLLAVFATLSNPPAHAGWFSRGPDPKTEAANRALERAAQIATEAAHTQSIQQSQLLQAVEALSNERTHLAAHLEQLGTLASRDSAWAAALQAASPVLVAIAVMVLGTMAVWMVTRAGTQDSHVASMLVDELVGSGAGFLVGDPGQRGNLSRTTDTTGPSFHSLARTAAVHNTQEGELPF